MSNDVSQSAWRIELAGELASVYAGRPEVEMIVLGGSPSRGISDEFSDLDVIVFWNGIDRDWIDTVPLGHLDCRRTDLMKLGEDMCLESYHFGNLKADFGHIEMKAWREMVDQVVVELNTDAGLQKSLQGFLDSIVLHGEKPAASWKAEIAPYPEGLGEKMVRENMRFFVEGYLLNQAWGRGDKLAYFDGVCLMLKNILGVLAGLNRIYFSKDEPRWLISELNRMNILPDGAADRFNAILQEQPVDAVPLLETLMENVFALVELHMPDVDVESKRRRRRELGVLSCAEKPPTKNTGMNEACT